MQSKELTIVTSKDIFGKEYQVPVNELKWSHSAYAAIIHDHRILLINQAGGYTMPGGTVNLGEPPEITVLREVAEETGHEGHEQALNFEPQWLPLDQLDHIKVDSSVNWLKLIRPLL